MEVNKTILLWYILPFLLFNSYDTYSQLNFTKEYSVDNILISSDNYMTLQDSKGYMWICSENGIVKFDGVKSKVFTVKNGLPSNDIWYINEDNQGKIWLGGFYKGLYYIENDSVKKNNTGENIFTTLYIKTINDTLFFTSYYGEGYYMINNHIKKKTKFIDGNYYSVIYHHSKNLAILYDKINGRGFTFFNNKKTDISELNWVESINRFNSSFIKKSLSASDYIIFNDHELKYVNIDKYLNGKVSSLLTIKPNNNIYTVVNDTVKIFTDIISLKRNYNLEKRLSPYKGIRIHSIYIDNEDNIWLTKYRGEIIFIPYNNYFINRYNFNENSIKNHTLDLTLNKDGLYFHDLIGNLYVFNLKTKKNHKIIANDFSDDYNRIRFLNSNNNKIYSSSTNSIKTIDSNNFIQEFLSYPISSITPHHFNFINDSTIIFSDFSTYSIIKNGTIKSKKIASIDDKTYCIIKTKKHFISGGSSGLYIKKFNNDSIKKLNINNIKCLVQHYNQIIIGTNGEGVVILDSLNNIKTKKYSDLTINDIKVFENLIFIGTNKGIYIDKIIKDSLVNLKTISFENGLTSNNVNSLLIIKDVLYAGTDNGLNEIYYKDILSKKSVAPKIYLEKVYVNNSIINDTNFKHNQNNITFYLTGISFYSLGEIKYQYKLKGLEKNWNTTNNNEVKYNFLPAGNYTFMAKAISVNGVESNNIIEYNFNIDKYFTQKWWFKSLITTLILTIIIFSFLYYQKRKVNKLKTEEKLAKIEMMALQSQMNPHFIFNSLNAIQSVMFLKSEKEANDYIVSFSRLIRKTLDNSRVNSISLEDEIDYLKLYIELEKKRLFGNLNYNINIANNLLVNEIFVPCMLFQPLIENAIIHGLIPKKNNRELNINFYIENKKLYGEVVDNGVGRKKTEKRSHKSWSSNILKEKIDVLNRINKHKITHKIIDLYSNNKPIGTKIIISIPLENFKVK